MRIKISTFARCLSFRLMAFLVCVTATMNVGAKEFTTKLNSSWDVTYLVNTTDKIARVKSVTETKIPSSTTVTIPKTVKYTEGSKTYTLTVTGIADEAFKDTYIFTVNLPSSIKTIGKNAFRYSYVKKCDLPSNLERIGDGAFQDASLAGIVNIPPTCRYIGKNAFTGTQITSVNFTQGGEYVPLEIGEYAFSVSMLETFTLNRVSTLGEGVFSMCDRLRNLNISGNVTAIPRVMCYSCESLTQIGLPAVQSIGEMAFTNCSSLKEFPFMPGLKSIGDSAFECNDLTSARLPAGFETLGERAFFDNENMLVVEFPASMKSVGQAAFQRCFKINTVECDAVTPPAMMDASFQKYEGVTVWVPVASVPAYKSSMGWRCFNYSHLTGAGIEDVEHDGAPACVRRYDLNGNQIPDGLEFKGIYIEVRDGKSRVNVN